VTEQLEERVRALEATVAELGARLRLTEDESEIKRLQRSYMNALMTQEWDVAIDCFSADALIDVHLH